MDNDTKRRRALADFLRTRRARLHPDQLGLTSVGRRRTPGLRRDEVAQLAGVGVSWYTWLEQGRDITVSDQVLECLAQTLQLENDERRHLFLLARGMVPVTQTGAPVAYPPEIQTLLDALGVVPAYLVDHHLTVVAWNESARRIFGDFALLAEKERNRVWSIFMDPASRHLFVHWEEAARHAVMNFRAAYDQYSSDAWFEEFLTDLQRHSPEFCVLWEQHHIETACHAFQEKELNHPYVGLLYLSSVLLVVPVDPPFHIVTLASRSPETTRKLEALRDLEAKHLLHR